MPRPAQTAGDPPRSGAYTRRGAPAGAWAGRSPRAGGPRPGWIQEPPASGLGPRAPSPPRLCLPPASPASRIRWCLRLESGVGAAWHGGTRSARRPGQSGCPPAREKGEPPWTAPSGAQLQGGLPYPAAAGAERAETSHRGCLVASNTEQEARARPLCHMDPGGTRVSLRGAAPRPPGSLGPLGCQLQVEVYDGEQGTSAHAPGARGQPRASPPAGGPPEQPTLGGSLGTEPAGKGARPSTGPWPWMPSPLPHVATSQAAARGWETPGEALPLPPHCTP